ncbi:MAG TPA: sigma-54-dependent Fis family transcriptional regulator [Chromatiaceae bacterium]|nr:sigma-54-dependent Fis family transcriptional regulator [Chromatiaceae bacterium]
MTTEAQQEDASVASKDDLTEISIVLLDPDQAHVRYMNDILDFVGMPCLCMPDMDTAIDTLRERAGVGSVCLLIGQDVEPDEAQRLMTTLDELDQAIPIFALVARDARPMQPMDNARMLGALTLPTQYDTFMSLLHKAHVYIESHTGQTPKRRPLELFRSLSGNSRATRRINKLVEQVANTEATVLILGESGTGKEVVARKLHYHSSRRGKPFVPVNCGAIPADLLESELFGHEKGAFTGAISARKGRFELAEAGTLFLDEIGDMSMHMQVKILRVLQERTFERVGGSKTLHCDVRIIAATHRNLEQAIKDGNFREDLFYRLNVFPIDMPPLRDRADDIPVLVTDLIRRIENEKRGSVRLTPAAVTALTHYSWPGNVRELANLIERLAILFPYGVVDVMDLPEKFREGYVAADHPDPIPEVTVPGDEPNTVAVAPRLPNGGIDLKSHLAEMEQSLIRQALEESDGVVAHAAKKLNMRRTTLVEKLRKYGMQRSTETSEF